MMSRTSSDSLQVYLKIIEYKRSIGTTQWTILSIFVTASGGVLVFSLNQQNRLTGLLVRFLGIMIYLFGCLLYNRYREMNQHISNYLVELEQENGFKLQQILNNQFHKSGLSTKSILLIAGIFYVLFSAVISILAWVKNP
jgi:hypothetical protein